MEGEGLLGGGRCWRRNEEEIFLGIKRRESIKGRRGREWGERRKEERESVKKGEEKGVRKRERNGKEEEMKKGERKKDS